MDSIKSLADAITGLTSATTAKQAREEAREVEAQKAIVEAQDEQIGSEISRLTGRSVSPGQGRFLQRVLDSGSDLGSRAIPMPEEWERKRKLYGPAQTYGRILRACAVARVKMMDLSEVGHIRAMHDLFRDKEGARWLESAIAKDLSAGVPSEGGYLIPEVILDDVVELLRAASVVMALGATELPMPNGVLSLPRIATGTTATYEGEADPPNATSMTFGKDTFRAKKLIAIVPISNDLLLVPSVSADTIVARDAIASLQVRMDKAALIDEGTENTPRGLLYFDGVSTASMGGAWTSDNPMLMRKALLDANVVLSGLSREGWTFNPESEYDLLVLKSTEGHHYFRDEMMQRGTLLGKPYKVSQQIPKVSSTTYAFYGDWSEYIIARQGMMSVDASSEAAYNNSSGTVVAAFSKDQTVIRVIDRHDMGPRQAAALCKTSGLTT